MPVVVSSNRGAAADAAPEIANLLSPSQVSAFVDCQFRWYAKYVLRLPDPKNANLALGIATHEALALYYQARMSDTALEPAEVADLFSASWRAQLEDAELREEDNPKELEATARALVSRYVAEVAPDVHPAAVEETVQGVISGVRVQGKVDVRETSGRLRDIKTAARKPSGVSAQHAFQLATYLQITPAAANVAVVDTLVKTKVPQLVQIQHRIDDQEIRSTQRMYPLVQEAMRGGIYVPNRGSTLCSRKNCPFWRVCQEEFGGRISES
jgi:PD-(D/E)XK nuclease superfamily